MRDSIPTVSSSACRVARVSSESRTSAISAIVYIDPPASVMMSISICSRSSRAPTLLYSSISTLPKISRAVLSMIPPYTACIAAMSPPIVIKWSEYAAPPSSGSILTLLQAVVERIGLHWRSTSSGRRQRSLCLKPKSKSAKSRPRELDVSKYLPHKSKSRSANGR